MKLSVILPCYNGAATIAIQLDALVQQSWVDDWEVIVVNNGSTDHSMDIVETYRDRLPNLRIVQAYEPPAPRPRVSHSYNVGLQAATGDAFVFCEADDEVAPDWLTVMGQGLLEHDCVAGSLDYTKLNEPWVQEMHGSGAQSAAKGLQPVKFPPYLPFFMDVTLECIVGSIVFLPSAKIYYRVRHELKAIYRQSRRWGSDQPLIRKRYGSGMGKLELPRRIFFLLKHVLGIRKVYHHRKRGV
jgi:glycosyltransferase involved in cell wall biosynthesis